MNNIDARSLAFPNLFYDIIVFLTPTLTFLIGLAAGTGVLSGLWSSISSDQGGGLLVLIVSLVVFFVGYEYGRLAETYSDVFVGMPIRILKKLGVLGKNGDFGKSLDYQVKLLGIDIEHFQGRTKSKWTLYFYAIQNAPLVGADLLKRYAWEKLARSEGFSFFLLFSVSVSIHLSNYLTGNSVLQTNLQFGSTVYLVTSFALYIVAIIDYYKRNAWNADLLITTIPIIVNAVAGRKNIQVPVDSEEAESTDI